MTTTTMRRLIPLLLFLSSPALAQQPPPRCDQPEHRQFDFWVGEWDVDGMNGPAGESSITSSLDGCVVREEWRGRSGYSGSSLNFYDRATGRWHQTWIATDGNPLFLEGGLDARGSMVLGSTREGRTDRITWTPDADGTVRQLWERSTDGGATWNVLFDGRYKPKSR